MASRENGARKTEEDWMSTEAEKGDEGGQLQL